MDYKNKFLKIREATRHICEHAKIDEMLLFLAEQLEDEANINMLIKANKTDVDKITSDSSQNIHLKLSHARIAGIATNIRAVAMDASPLEIVLKSHTYSNGLEISKISAPLGVVYIVCDARPDIIFDMFSLCIKAGNACVLKLGDCAKNTAKVAEKIIKNALQMFGFDSLLITLLPNQIEKDVEVTQYVDLVIPLVASGTDVVHVFYDESANREQAMAIINSSKTRHNALDCLLVHRNRLYDLSIVFNPLADARITIFADNCSIKALRGRYPADLLMNADENTYGKNFMLHSMALKTVDDLEDALKHISRYGSRHCEAIISNSEENIEIFLNRVDATKLYVNASTSFNVCPSLGLGAEKDKIHARRPIGINELTSYRCIVRGNGQTVD